MISYPSIDQFRNAIKAVQHRTWYVGKDETGDAIYDRTRVPPKLIFRGYVKAHGTNAGVVYDFTTGNFEYQSRSRVLSLESDNNQFMFHMSAHEDIWADIHRQILGLLGTSVYPTKIAIFGEWCGQGIQKGVAIAEVPKMFLVFGLRVFFAGPLIGESYSDWQDDQNSIWIDPSELELHFPEERIFNIATFGKYDVEIDFANPAYSQNKIIELTEAVEAECPIGKYFGISGVGEGIVFHNVDNTLPGEIRFKSKGEKHSVSKVKTLNVVDVEALENLEAFIEATVTENRLEQGLQYIQTELQLPLEMKSIGPFIKWTYGDIIKEELDCLRSSGLDPKKIGGPVANKARPWFTKKINELASLGV